MIGSEIRGRQSVTYLNTLRAGLTRQQKRLLNCIWNHRLGSTHLAWPKATTVLLELNLPDDAAVRRIAPAGCTWDTSNDADPYALTLQGVLLTQHGRKNLRLLSAYGQFLCKHAKANPTLPHVHASEVRKALHLSAEDSRLLVTLIHVADLCAGMTAGEEWVVGVPSNIAALRHIGSFPEYLCEKAIRDGRRAEAQLGVRLQSAARNAVPTVSRFAFLRNTTLRTVAETDHHEAQVCAEVGAWKSCVIMCGGVVECLLLDLMERRQVASGKLANGANVLVDTPARRKTLVELVTNAETLGVLHTRDLHLTTALRFSRDLIHPGRTLRLRQSVDREDATLALSTVEKVCRALLAHYEAEARTP
jgi:hypothetical protein